MGFSCKEYKFQKTADLVMRQIDKHFPYLPNIESQKQLAQDVDISLEKLLRVLSFLTHHKYLDINYTYTITEKWREIERNGGFKKAYFNQFSPLTFFILLLTFLVALGTLMISLFGTSCETCAK